MKECNQYFFTFMFKQGRLANKAVVFDGNYGESREKMINVFGEEWAFQYPIDELDYQKNVFGLEVVTMAEALKELV